MTLKFEGGEFINLVSPDFDGHSWDPPYGSAPSSLVHTFGAELVIFGLIMHRFGQIQAPPNLTTDLSQRMIFVELGSAVMMADFDVGEWSNIIGNGLAQNIHTVLNDQSFPLPPTDGQRQRLTSLIICRMASMS